MHNKNFYILTTVLCFCFLAISTSSLLAKNPHGYPMSGEDALILLTKNNALVQQLKHNNADISLHKKQFTTENGQKPYAVVITCADSRVPPEHIFAAGIGELFVIRNAGNIIGTHELGSIEYAVEHLNVKLILVMGHTHCGAVKAALSCSCEHEQKSSLQDVVHHIHTAIKGEKDPRQAEITNIEHSMQNILAYPKLKKLMQENAVLLKGALYHIDSGSVDIISSPQP